MEKLSTSQIREKFLAYFEKQGHTRVVSSSLIPGNDPTLLFTNAGMVQFKDIFLGQEKRAYVRATSSQRCVRAGGKHNDLENVGYTARHHTFFEMLGNFSFGDYFKREAIRFAWEFLTQELKIPREKLWVTVFREDDEAYDIWIKEIGFDPARMSRCDEKDNFWMMGDTGPCGPCSEIFYDHGEGIWGGPPGTPAADGDRYIEIWNMVFMQYQRFADGSQIALPKPSVDTGMGLERIAAVMQGVHDNYDIDLFQALIKAIVDVMPAQAGIQEEVSVHSKSLHVIADHIRSVSFLIADGVLPSNEGRGYVLRRILRRAVRHGHQLGMSAEFFHRLVAPLAAVMGEAYPALKEKQSRIEDAIRQEERQFAVTLEKGLKVLESVVMPAQAGIQEKGVIRGDIIFKLYDTYGFPVDLTADIAREKNLTLDMAGFEEAMAEQRKKSQSASTFSVDYNQQLKVDSVTSFTGYDLSKTNTARVISLFKENQPVTQLQTGETGVIVIDQTPFYAQGGGQVGDKGILRDGDSVFEVSDTQSLAQAYLHQGQVLKGTIKVGDRLMPEVDTSLREATARNHSATHLLQAALRKILGTHVEQKGSLVNHERLRFDFSHTAALSTSEIEAIEKLVNEKIQANLPVEAKLMSASDAQKAGAMALFGEKYGDTVRVLSMGDFSKELCGGTHVHRTGDIGLFFIIEETGIASGVRRLEAITGQAALTFVQAQRAHHKRLTEILKTKEFEAQIASIEETKKQIPLLEKKCEQLQLESQRTAALQHVQLIKERTVILFESTLETKLLRPLIDELKKAIGQGVIFLWNRQENKINLAIGVTDTFTSQVKANELAKAAIELLSGKGGGKADFAQVAGVFERESADLEARLRSLCPN